MNTAEILMMKYPANADFDKIGLRQLADGTIEIYLWELDDPKPTQDDLDRWAQEFDLPFRQKKAVEARRYPSVGDQLDMVYHDMMDSTTVWMDTITKIKTDNPKPMV